MKKKEFKWLGIGLFIVGLYFFLQSGGILALYALSREESIASLGLSETVVYGILAMAAGAFIYYKKRR